MAITALPPAGSPLAVVERDRAHRSRHRAFVEIATVLDVLDERTDHTGGAETREAASGPGTIAVRRPSPAARPACYAVRTTPARATARSTETAPADLGAGRGRLFGDLLFKMPAALDCPSREPDHFGDGGFASFPSRHDTAANAKQLCGLFLSMAESLSPSLESLCVH
jgi:hypothetical protein